MICEEQLLFEWVQNKCNWFFVDAVQLVLQNDKGMKKTVVHHSCFEIWRNVKGAINNSELSDFLTK
jgi:hypothetical protein